MHPLGRVKLEWSPKLAYAIGLIVTDGNLSKSGRHIVLVSKDLDQIKTFKTCLNINNKICLKRSGFVTDKKYYFVQFGDVNFYNFLLGIGLKQAKSKTLGALKIPEKYFADFLRGNLDGDGTFYSYWDKRWASSFLFYLGFTSASLSYLRWLRRQIKSRFGPKGHISMEAYSKAYQLRYAKQEAEIVIKKMYYNPQVPKLRRKFVKIQKALTVNNKHDKLAARVL